MAALPLQTRCWDTKALLVQAVPPLHWAYLRAGQKNAFIIPQNGGATAMAALGRASRPSAGGAGTSCKQRTVAPGQTLAHTHARAWRFGGPESLTPREGASPVLLKEMNDFVFELDLLGKEFLRMANSVSTKFMT